MAKLLPCLTCRREARLPDHVPYYIGRVERFPFSYECAECGRKTTISATEFNSIPEEVMPDQPPMRVAIRPDLMRRASGEKFVPPRVDVPPRPRIDTPDDVS